MTDFRALCAELVEKLDELNCHYNVPSQSAMIERAHAVLADEPAVPTVMEIVELADKIEAAGLGQVDLVRAALTRWGTSNLAETRSSLGGMPTPVPADKGEVEELVVDELVKRLRTKAATEKANRCHYSAILLTRAADLLEQRHPAPVPVSERLPGDQLCWWFEADEDCGYGSSWTLLRIRGSATGYTHCLPAHALPIPHQQENAND